VSMTKYFVQQDGTYIGGFCDLFKDGQVISDAATQKVPPGSIEVPFPPDHAHQKWNFQTNQYNPLEE